ncbi:DNA-formamidopyrimidine glycosylase family protein [Mucilaginibacter ginkgonis]|uniref:Fpg/Nei family DNA glycosylase n=1 Tax=Mucilaginibacter ginkgonis TaxID=2682091 RepID=A0A6I4HZS9_9SPHI|nr:DNA-formamidopyrimidine glycosylase family protein [Mucilaginibacter ginkgonis]QQL49913.1 Fpg/Nei family DNA glycosylase [Mucilaginibacter ginkgonis]
MPEIPDLNIFVKNLSKRLVGKRLSNVVVLITRQLKVSSDDLAKALEGHILVGIERVGKELHFKFNNGTVLGIHLMLHGTLYWFEEKNENKFSIAELHFGKNLGLAITDWQKAVMLKLNPDPVKVPDALDVKAKYLETACAKTSHYIKTVLTDGKTVGGIGNAYVDEILYDAQISPFSKADKLPPKAIMAIAKSIKSVLKKAEDHIEGNFPDTISEKERDFLQVHRPKQAKTLSGEDILKAEIDKRKTYYTASQKLFE